MKTFASRATIRATPDRIWAILTDASRYTAWNTTIDRLEGRIARGETLTLHVKVNPGRAFPVKVNVMEPPKRMVWTGGLPLGLFKGERVFTLTPRGAETEFSMRESFTGPLAPLFGRMIPDLQPAFEEFAAALKTEAERAR